jgi:hypothetical protein
MAPVVLSLEARAAVAPEEADIVCTTILVAMQTMEQLLLAAVAVEQQFPAMVEARVVLGVS